MAHSRLSPDNLALAAAAFRTSKSRPAPGIVHLGIGAFFRAQTALYTQEAIAAAGGDWGVIGVSLRSPQQRDLLAPQDFLYTAIERDAGGAHATIVNILREILVAPENPAAVLERMARPSTRIVTLTVTEKGYCHDPANGTLNWDHPDIKHDLSNPHAPRSAVGFIVEALRLRKENSVAPFTAITCDNLPNNGKLLEGLVRAFAQRLDPALGEWIASYAAFPSCMVDRIVPATTEKDIDDAARLTGLADAAPVTHEPYRQWVIEDRFVDGVRPSWDRCGVEFVANVAPYENMKLRLLNASHSALAYLGYLAGYETIADAVADRDLRDFVERLWREEIIPVTPIPQGTDALAYVDALMRRYSNTEIRHRTWQIAMDGSQKLPQRILQTVRARLHSNLSITHLALVVAAWIRYVRGIDEAGKAIDVRDPFAADLKAAIGRASNGAGDVRAALSFAAIFGDLSKDARFAVAVIAAYERLQNEGARRAARSETESD
jgi:fructuronate reductase